MDLGAKIVANLWNKPLCLESTGQAPPSFSRCNGGGWFLGKEFSQVCCCPQKSLLMLGIFQECKMASCCWFWRPSQAIWWKALSQREICFLCGTQQAARCVHYEYCTIPSFATTLMLNLSASRCESISLLTNPMWSFCFVLFFSKATVWAFTDSFCHISKRPESNFVKLRGKSKGGGGSIRCYNQTGRWLFPAYLQLWNSQVTKSRRLKKEISWEPFFPGRQLCGITELEVLMYFGGTKWVLLCGHLCIAGHQASFMKN